MGISEILLSWDEIVDRVQNGDLNFNRTKRVADLYRTHRNNLAHEWRDLESYCKHRILKYPLEKKVFTDVLKDGATEERVLKCVEPNSECSGRRLVIADNEFPYSFVSDVQHKLVWSADEISLEEYKQFVERHFSSDEYDVIVFVNPIHLKSVRGVHHAHVLLRRKH